jgi:transcriptional regulator with XRE-family HTH domain
MSGPNDAEVETIYKTVGRRVKRARSGANLTQDDLAQKISLSRTSIANLERGRQRIMVHCLDEIANALNVPISSLLPTRTSENLEERTRKVIDTVSDSDEAAAAFISEGLKKAGVL